MHQRDRRTDRQTDDSEDCESMNQVRIDPLPCHQMQCVHHQYNHAWPVRCGWTTAHLLTPRLLCASPAVHCMFTVHYPGWRLTPFARQRWGLPCFTRWLQDCLHSSKVMRPHRAKANEDLLCWCTCAVMPVNCSHLLCQYTAHGYGFAFKLTNIIWYYMRSFTGHINIDTSNYSCMILYE